MPSRKLKIRSALIVDDHPLFCDALSMTLRGIAEIERVKSASTLADALDQVRRGLRPDVIVLDLNLPDADGMEGLIQLKAASQCPVIVVSSMSDDRVIGMAIRSGASGFVPKHSQRVIFNQALTEISQGHVFVPQGYVEAEYPDESSAQDDAASRLASLTEQQSKILRLICEGKLNKQIAFELSIAEATVKAHVTAIMRKLGVRSRTQAALLVKSSRFENMLLGESSQP